MAEEEGSRFIGTTDEDIIREIEGTRNGGASDLDLDRDLECNPPQPPPPFAPSKITVSASESSTSENAEPGKTLDRKRAHSSGNMSLNLVHYIV